MDNRFRVYKNNGYTAQVTLEDTMTHSTTVIGAKYIQIVRIMEEAGQPIGDYINPFDMMITIETAQKLLDLTFPIRTPKKRKPEPPKEEVKEEPKEEVKEEPKEEPKREVIDAFDFLFGSSELY